MSAGGSLEGVLAVKGTSDDSADSVLALQYLARYLTVAVELLARYDRFVGCYLENAVCRSIDDELSACEVLFAKVADNVGSGVGKIAYMRRFLSGNPELAGCSKSSGFPICTS